MLEERPEADFFATQTEETKEDTNEEGKSTEETDLIITNDVREDLQNFISEGLGADASA